MLRRAWTAGLALATAGLLAGCPATYVRQGHVGLVVDNFTGQIVSVAHPGLTPQVPLGQHVIEFPVMVQQYVMVRGGERDGRDDGIRVNSLEGQTFVVDASVEFSIRSPQDVPGLYQRYGLEFDELVEQYYRSKFKAAMGTAFAGLHLNEAITGPGRRKVEETALVELRRRFHDDPIVIMGVLIRSVYLAPEIERAITAKTRAENELEQARTTAQQRVVEAEAAARVQLMQAEAAAKARVIEAQGEARANREVANSLSPRVLQLRLIERLSDKIQLVVPPNQLLNVGGTLNQVERQ